MVAARISRYFEDCQEPSKNRLFLFAAALLFSTGGAAIKACSLSSWQVAGFRSGIAAVVLYILLPGARPSAKPGWTWRTWLIGLAYAATMILFVLANKLTTSANAIFLQSTAPFYLLLLGPLVLARTDPENRSGGDLNSGRRRGSPAARCAGCRFNAPEPGSRQSAGARRGGHLGPDDNRTPLDGKAFRSTPTQPPQP